MHGTADKPLQTTDSNLRCKNKQIRWQADEFKSSADPIIYIFNVFNKVTVLPIHFGWFL